MKRDKLLNSKGYWLTQIQNELFGVIENYIKKKNINKSKLAEELKVTKGYVTQVMNGDFDHKLSKLVELSLACDTVPLLYFVDKSEYIKADSQDKTYEIMPMARPRNIVYQGQQFNIPLLSINTDNKEINITQKANSSALSFSEIA